MATTSGSSVSAANFNTLFSQIASIKSAQAARADLSSTQKTNINNISTTNVVKGNSVVPGDLSRVKTGLSTLASNGTGISSTFASNITVPSVGDLLKATDVSVAETSVAKAAAIDANCAYYTSAANRSHFSSNYGSESSQSFFSSNYGSSSSQSFFSSNYSSAGSRSNFSSNYSSNGSRSNFSSNYTSGTSVFSGTIGMF